MYELWLIFHWSLFLRVQLTIFQHRFRWWPDANQATGLYLNQWWLVYWRIYASLGINELTLGCNLQLVIFKDIAGIDILGISWEIALRGMPQNLTDDQSISVQVMAWCHQAPSHYLSQCWPKSLMPCGITGPQWVNPCHAEFDMRNIKL